MLREARLVWFGSGGLGRAAGMAAGLELRAIHLGASLVRPAADTTHLVQASGAMTCGSLNAHFHKPRHVLKTRLRTRFWFGGAQLALVLSAMPALLGAHVSSALRASAQVVSVRAEAELVAALARVDAAATLRPTPFPPSGAPTASSSGGGSAYIVVCSSASRAQDLLAMCGAWPWGDNPSGDSAAAVAAAMAGSKAEPRQAQEEDSAHQIPARARPFLDAIASYDGALLGFPPPAVRRSLRMAPGVSRMISSALR